MTTDKNGVELNIGDEVIYDHSIGLWKIKSISKKNNVIYCRSEIHETCLSTWEVTKVTPAPVECTYTASELYLAERRAFIAGLTHKPQIDHDVLFRKYKQPNTSDE